MGEPFVFPWVMLLWTCGHKALMWADVCPSLDWLSYERHYVLHGSKCFALYKLVYLCVLVHICHMCVGTLRAYTQ